MGNVNSEIARIEQAKDNIEAAIENCGVDVPDTELISDYATYINKIPAAVFAQFQLAKQGGTDQYIESVEQVNGTISVATGGLASTEASGLMSAADKIKLDILSNIPCVIGKDSDQKSKWTGESDAITKYVDGLSIIYVPKVAGTVSKLTLQINELPAKPITISENDYTSADIAAGSPLLLTYSVDSDKWFTTDCNQAFDIPNHVWICEDINKTKIIARGTYAVSPNSYVPIIMPGANSQTSASMRFFGTSSTFYPIYLNGQPVSESNYGIPKGFYLVYFDGSYVHLNTNGILPGKIDKSVIAETVEWNEVEGDNGDVSIGESSVTNSLYLYTHNLTNVSKKPSEYKNQYLTAWFSKTDMPITQTCSGINISSSSTNVNWQLCSQASNTYDRAYDRLWFRSGIGESWNPWQQVAFIHDLNTFKVKQEPVTDPTAEGVSTTFIDSISQDENGKITVTKKAIPNGSGGGGSGESSGTVSEVRLAMPDAFEVSGNPITTSGAFNVTLKSTHRIPTTDDVNKWNSYKSNVQADWAAEEGSDAYIHNKPEIPNVGAGVLTIKVNGSETQFSANSTENKTVTINTNNNIPMASETDLGGIRLGYTTDSASRNYKVQVNQYGDAYVNVPWVSGESGDTKNTAGATNNESDLFIIGSLDQSDNPQTYSNANIKISGNAIKASGGFYQESDERLKDFTEDIQVDLEQLSQLPKKHFTWKNDSKKETQIGTSAQELQKLYPELVKEDSNGTLSVAYDKLSIIALKAIDELYKRNIELEKRIQELENK